MKDEETVAVKITYAQPDSIEVSKKVTQPLFASNFQE